MMVKWVIAYITSTGQLQITSGETDFHLGQVTKMLDKHHFQYTVKKF